MLNSINLALKKEAKYMHFRKHALIENSFGIKSRCELLAKPESIEEIMECLRFAKENNLKVNILGRGTNTLICEDEIEGLIITIDDNLSTYSVQDNIISFQAGFELLSHFPHLKASVSSG